MSNKKLILKGSPPKLSQKLHPDYIKIFSGLWEVAVQSVSYNLTEKEENSLVDIQTNIVTSYTYDKQEQLSLHEVTIFNFNLTNNKDTKSVIYGNDLIFFEVNNPSDKFELLFKDSESGEQFTTTSTFIANCILRRKR